MESLPLRHELKYFINEAQYFVLSGVLDSVLQRDPNGDEFNEYHIRSLYFDTVFNDALFDKMDGSVEYFPIGATIGTHTGPGTVALFYWGARRA